MDMLVQVPYFPSVDGNVVATAIQRAPGGVGANIAVGLAQLGHSVILLGATGDDETGDFLRESLRKKGIDISRMLSRKGVATHSCFIAVNPHGERVIYGLPGAVAVETADELDCSAIRSAQAIHIAPSYKGVALSAIEEARAAGIFVSYTPADVWWPEGPAAVREIARKVDLLILNRVEAADLTGLSTPQRAIQQLAEWGYGSTVITVGEEGAWISNEGHIQKIPVFPRPDVRNTTGAGDAFTAGIVTGILLYQQLDKAARLGAAVASLKLREVGAQAGIPTLEEALYLTQVAT